MKCPHCNKSIEPNARYCPYCGGKADFTFDEIKSTMSRQDSMEKLEAKAAESRRVLMIALFLFLVSIIVYIAIPSPRIPEAVPVYRVEVPEKIHLEEVEVRAPVFDIPD